jgi:hypothetical protein
MLNNRIIYECNNASNLFTKNRDNLTYANRINLIKTRKKPSNYSPSNFNVDASPKHRKMKSSFNLGSIYLY